LFLLFAFAGRCTIADLGILGGAYSRVFGINNTGQAAGRGQMRQVFMLDISGLH
jgi:uncharacterized membrane protein